MSHELCGGQLSPAWTVDEAVAMLAALLSVDSYQLLVVQHAWPPEALCQRIWELCLGSFLVPERRTSATASKGARRTR